MLGWQELPGGAALLPADARLTLGCPPIPFPSRTHSSSPNLRWGCEEDLEGDSLGRGAGRGAPCPRVGEEARINSGWIPGPTQELSHGRGQREGGQETLNLLGQRRKGWGWPFFEGCRGCSCPAAARGRRAGLARGTEGGDGTGVPLGPGQRSWGPF